MLNRIKTILEHGGLEWRNDLKLAALTIFCCAGIILFFSADDLLGAVLLRANYFRYGMVVALLLVTSLVFVIMKWVGLPVILRLVGTSIFLIVASPFFASQSLTFLATYFSSFIMGIGLIFFIPTAFITWFGIAIFAWLRGWLSDYLTEPLLVRVIIIGSLIFTAFYVSFRHIQSSDFTIINYQVNGENHFYSVSRTSISSDTGGGTAYYKCNTISLFCTEVSEFEQPKEAQ